MSYTGPLNLLLKNSVFKHPKENNSQQDYFHFLIQNYNDIKKALTDLANSCARSRPVDYLTSEIVKIQNYIFFSCDEIECVLRLYLKGEATNAFKKLENYLNQNKYLRVLSSIPQNQTSSILGSLFKIRKNDTPARNYSGAEMFHIPLDLRHLVPSCRFSMPGIPCLYLANNLYICSLEVNANNNHDYQASRVQLRGTVSVLNLAYSIHEVQQWSDMWYDSLIIRHTNNQHIADLVVAWFAMYPLMLASAIKTIPPKAGSKLYSQGASFIPEYIIPQLLMQYVTESRELDGIRYLSTKCISDDGWIKFYVCWAFPAKSDRLQGFAPNLKNLFEITDGIQLPVSPRPIRNKNVFNGKIKNNVLILQTNYQTDPPTRVFAEAEDELWNVAKHPMRVIT